MSATATRAIASKRYRSIIVASIIVTCLGAAKYVEDNVPRPIWVVAHRVNDTESIARALIHGANAIEFDVMSGEDGFRVRHPGPIDFSVPTVREYAAVVLQQQEQLALLYIDYKGPDFSENACARLLADFGGSGIRESGIYVVFSVASLANSSCLRAVPKEAWIAPQLDQANDPDSAVAFFQDAGFQQAWYGDGITSILPEPARVLRNITRGIALRDEDSVIRGVGVWTLDAKSSMRRYLRLGVNMILTNDPPDMLEVLREREFRETHRVATRRDAPR